MTPQPKTVIYTDGASIGNPGPGGYGVIVVQNGEQQEFSGGFRKTTNNRMEILAAIIGLEALKKPSQVTLYSDSKYLVDAVMKEWIYGWRSKQWKKGKVKNIDLWKRLLPLLEKHTVKFRWVKGHAGHAENERCDKLANRAAKKSSLPPDKGYEQEDPQTAMF